MDLYVLSSEMDLYVLLQTINVFFMRKHKKLKKNFWYVKGGVFVEELQQILEKLKNISCP